MKQIEINFPSKFELDTVFERIKNKNYTNEDIDKITDWYFKFNTLWIYTPNSYAKLYRCSRIDETNRNINDYNTFSYPKEEFCELGRCNTKENPVLYLSVDENTPFFEIKAKVGEEIYLSEWIFNPIKIIFEQRLFYSPLFFTNKDSYAYIFAQSVEEKISEQFNSLPNPYKSNVFYFLEKMNEIIRLDSPDYYCLTSVLCNKTFRGFDTENKGNINIDIISYPSVSTNHESINFAFNTKIVDKRIVCLNKVYKVLVTEVNKEDVKCVLLKEASVIKNNVSWYNVHNQ